QERALCGYHALWIKYCNDHNLPTDPGGKTSLSVGIRSRFFQCCLTLTDIGSSGRCPLRGGLRQCSRIDCTPRRMPSLSVNSSSAFSLLSFAGLIEWILRTEKICACSEI